MEVFGVDRGFKIVTANIPYFNLQWNRKYYECGSFSIQITPEVYDSDWRYIMSHDRPEIAFIQKVEFSSEGQKLITLSGFFAESLLDGITCIPRFTHDYAQTETTIKALLDTYKAEAKKGIKFVANASPLGNRTESDFIGDKLGEKIYSILQSRELGFRISTGDDFSGLFARVWQGVDRTQSQDKNAWVVFSSTFGNISKIDISTDSSAFANVCKVSAADETLQFEVDRSAGGERFEISLDKSSEKKKDGQSDADFRAAMEQEANEKLDDLAVVWDISVSNLGDYGYMSDYDLGDIIELQVDETNISAQLRIVEATEVFKDSGHGLTLGFGTKRISNLRRVKL